MDFIQNNLLTLTIFFPLMAAAVIFLLPSDAKRTIRWLALILSLVPLVMVLMMWFSYDRVDAGIQFETAASWFPTIGAGFHVGIDGISLAMFLLTAILTPLSILASFQIEDNPRMFMFLFLVMESAMLGLFSAMDLLLFFVFGNLGWCPCISSSRFGVGRIANTHHLSFLYTPWRGA